MDFCSCSFQNASATLQLDSLCNACRNSQLCVARSDLATHCRHRSISRNPLWYARTHCLVSPRQITDSFCRSSSERDRQGQSLHCPARDCRKGRPRHRKLRTGSSAAMCWHDRGHRTAQFQRPVLCRWTQRVRSIRRRERLSFRNHRGRNVGQ